MDSLVPIVLFAYNRPDHLRQTVDSLAACPEARASQLLIYSDGPRDSASQVAVDAVRQFARKLPSKEAFAAVRIIERKQNLGLAASIIDGVTQTCREFGSAIVLEDDLIVSSAFLDYMNSALNRFSAEESVMHVSGYMYPIAPDGLRETFFLPPTTCWGWATWQRAWQHFANDAKLLHASFSLQERRKFNLDHRYPYWRQVEDNLAGKINTWAIFWYASVFRKQGLCLHPRSSFVRNIGHDDSGHHCGSSTVFDVALNDEKVREWPITMAIENEALMRLQDYFWHILPSRARAKLGINRLCENLLP